MSLILTDFEANRKVERRLSSHAIPSFYVKLDVIFMWHVVVVPNWH